MLQNRAENCGMEISPERSKMIAVLGQSPERCKTVVDNKCFKQERDCKY
jgi:hypothetical protein